MSITKNLIAAVALVGAFAISYSAVAVDAAKTTTKTEVKDGMVKPNPDGTTGMPVEEAPKGNPTDKKDGMMMGDAKDMKGELKSETKSSASVEKKDGKTTIEKKEMEKKEVKKQ